MDLELNDPALLRTDGYVGGRWIRGPDRFAVTDPATGGTVARVARLDADAARETLAGALTVADTLDPATAEALRTAAAHAFDAGVGITAVIGAVLVGIAAVIAATTLRTTPTNEESDVARHQIGTDPR